MRNTSKLVTAGVLASLLAGGAVLPAAAHDPASATHEAPERIAPDALDGNAQVSTEEVADTPLSVELDEDGVSLPTAVGSPVTVDTSQGAIEIELPLEAN